MDDAKFI